MLEIYNEQVRDLLDSRPPKKGGLRVRQHPKQGFYGKLNVLSGYLYSVFQFSFQIVIVV